MLDPMRMSALIESHAHPTNEVFSYDGKGMKLAFRQANAPVQALRPGSSSSSSAGSSSSSSGSSSAPRRGRGLYGGEHSAVELLRQLDDLQAEDAEQHSLDAAPGLSSPSHITQRTHSRNCFVNSSINFVCLIPQLSIFPRAQWTTASARFWRR